MQRQKALLAATDAIAVVGAAALSQVIRTRDLYPLRPGSWGEALAGMVTLVAVWILVARTVGLYRNGRRREVIAIVKASGAAWLTMVAISFFLHIAPSRFAVASGLALTIGLVMIARVIVRRSMKFFYSRPQFAVPLVIVGANTFGIYLRDRIRAELTHYEFLGFVDESPCLTAANGSNGNSARVALRINALNSSTRLRSDSSSSSASVATPATMRLALSSDSN